MHTSSIFESDLVFLPLASSICREPPEASENSLLEGSSLPPKQQEKTMLRQRWEPRQRLAAMDVGDQVMSSTDDMSRGKQEHMPIWERKQTRSGAGMRAEAAREVCESDILIDELSSGAAFRSTSVMKEEKEKADECWSFHM